MGGIPIIVLVVFLVIWVLTNVLRAQQDDSRNTRRPQPGAPANRPAGQPLERNTASDIDRFLAEIDRLRQKGKAEDESPSAQRPTPAPRTAAPAAPRPRPQPRPQPAATRARPTLQPRPAPAARPTVTPPPLPATHQPAPAAPAAPAPAPAGPISTHGDLRFAEESRQRSLPKPSAPGGAVSPSAPKPPQLGSAMEVVQTLFRARKGAAAAILVSEILGRPKSKRR